MTLLQTVQAQHSGALPDDLRKMLKKVIKKVTKKQSQVLPLVDLFDYLDQIECWLWRHGYQLRRGDLRVSKAPQPSKKVRKAIKKALIAAAKEDDDRAHILPEVYKNADRGPITHWLNRKGFEVGYMAETICVTWEPGEDTDVSDYPDFG